MMSTVLVQTTVLILSMLLVLTVSLTSSDIEVMNKIKDSLDFSKSTVNWSSSKDQCDWDHVGCANNRVTRIQLGSQNLAGTLSPAIANLTNLEVLELMNNNLTGSLPRLSGLVSLQMLNLHSNKFNSIDSGFFDGLKSLTSVYLDDNPFTAWSIPDGLRTASSLTNFSAVSANVSGKIPEFFNSITFPSLSHLHMSRNNFQGALPSSFATLTSLKTLWLSGRTDSSDGRTLGGSIVVLQNMTGLVHILLNFNGFTGPIPDLVGLSDLEELNLRDNFLTGPVPTTLYTNMTSLKVVNLTNNALQGPTPNFPTSVSVDMIDHRNSFCLNTASMKCDSRVDSLVAALEPFGYPFSLASEWKGNNPCTFKGISCGGSGNITVINFSKMNLNGTISPRFADLTSVRTLNLANNNLTGRIPDELAKLPNLKVLDVSFNHLDVRNMPVFPNSTAVNIDNNDGGNLNRSSGGASSGASSKTKNVVGAVFGVIGFIILAGVVILYFMKKRGNYGRVKSDIPSNHSGSDIELKYTNRDEEISLSSSGPSDAHLIEPNNMVISIEVLRNVTSNFSEDKILGKGGFGTVYKGILADGTKIAVKRMNAGVLGDKGLAEFKSEISVLSKVRHRHLVGLLGFCLEGNEKILVFEYLPQGTLSSRLFNWEEEGLKPLDWKQRLMIALDVARGVEYLHNLAHQCFIHRDLKPSNILLGDDMRAKVADFGLVRLAPDGVNASIATKLAGTFGYLAPEYATTGRITTKIDIYAFGVILMELITGRKALDESQPEESVHLVTWFRRMYINNTIHKAIDPTIDLDLDQETLSSINTIADLAGHCCAREPSQRPEMSNIVNIISSLTNKWTPTERNNNEDEFGVDDNMSLPQALQQWQALDDSNVGTSSFFVSDNTQTSLPTKPSGFAESFTSLDGR